MVISMEVLLGDHRIYSHFVFTNRPENNLKKQVDVSRQKLRIFQRTEMAESMSWK